MLRKNWFLFVLLVLALALPTACTQKQQPPIRLRQLSRLRPSVISAERSVESVTLRFISRPGVSRFRVTPRR